MTVSDDITFIILVRLAEFLYKKSTNLNNNPRTCMQKMLQVSSMYSMAVVAQLHIDDYLWNDVQTEGELQYISLFGVLILLILIANMC